MTNRNGSLHRLRLVTIVVSLGMVSAYLLLRTPDPLIFGLLLTFLLVLLGLAAWQDWFGLRR